MTSYTGIHKEIIILHLFQTTVHDLIILKILDHIIGWLIHKQCINIKTKRVFKWCFPVKGNTNTKSYLIKYQGFSLFGVHFILNHN